MKVLHTADWHVGKTVRGQSRAVEHRDALAEIAQIADTEAVDLVLVVGDVFDTAAPSPESERIVYRALLDLTSGGTRPVVVVAGNHDNPRRLGAVSPVFDLANVHVQTGIRPPGDGGVLELTVGPDAERARLALVPFLSQRYVVQASDLLQLDGTETGGKYAERLRLLIETLTEPFAPDAVNIVLAHVMVSGGLLGGGERNAHTIFDYWLAANAFPAGAHYVALGHLHRPQKIEGPCPIWYSGSPLAMDFGEEKDRKAVLIVEATATTPAVVRAVPLTSGRGFRTVRGTLADLRAIAAADPPEVADHYVRAIVAEQSSVGLAEQVRELFPNAVDIRIESPSATSVSSAPSRAGRTPHELFESYLDEQQVDDPRLVALFDELLQEAGDAAVGAEVSIDAP